MRTASNLPMVLPFPERTGVLSRVRASTWMAVFGLLVLFVALRWQTFDAPLIRDEGEYTYAAEWLLQGQLPYEHSFLQKPPMVVYTYALANLVAPDVFWMPRLLAALSVAASTVLLGYIVRQEFGRASVFPALFLFTPMVLMPKLAQSTANTEMFLLLPLMGTVALYVYDRHRGCTSKGWALAGALTALTLLYKYTMLPLLAVLWIGWLVEKWRNSRDWRAISSSLAFAAAGFALATGIVLAPFLIRDGGRHLWECTVVFNRAYTATGTFGLDPLYVRMSGFWRDWRVLCVLPLLLLAKEPPRIRWWLAICAAAFLSTAGSTYTQYYVPVTPFWSMICAVALVNFLTLIPSKFTRAEAWLRSLLAAGVVATACWPDLPLILPGGRQAARLNPVNPFPESLVAARRVAELTRPDDRVFVAGSEPQVLCYARRQSATRFIIAYPFMMATALTEKYQSEVIADLKEHPPAVVVRATANSSWLDGEGTPQLFRNFFWPMLARDYECVGGYVLGPQGGHWSEPLPSNQNMDLVSLTLYRRKTP
jgi:hypothetical protein